MTGPSGRTIATEQSSAIWSDGPHELEVPNLAIVFADRALPLRWRSGNVLALVYVGWRGRGHRAQTLALNDEAICKVRLMLCTSPGSAGGRLVGTSPVVRRTYLIITKFEELW